MSKALVPQDGGSNVVNSVVHDGVTVGVVVAAIAAHALVPVVGVFAFPAAGIYLGYRAIKKGLKRRR